MIQAWQLFDGTTKVHAPKEARSSGTRKGQGPQWVVSGRSRPVFNFQRGNLRCCLDRPEVIGGLSRRVSHRRTKIGIWKIELIDSPQFT